MSQKEKSPVEELALTASMLSVDAVNQANSGHPGLPMGAGLITSVIWADYLRANPQDPSWPNRDRFVLSAGHGSALLYSLLHLFGFDLSLEELKRFRQLGSITPGHPEFGMTSGVEATTGPLGQGFANGVGMALSGKLLAHRYGAELFDHRVFGLVSDGDVMEGIAQEAASLAGHLGLDNLIYVYDDNKVSLAGKTDVCFSEDVPGRFEALGWYVQEADGHDEHIFRSALERAIAEPGRPSLICAHTTIGYGSPSLAGSFKVHGSPLGKEEAEKTKAKLDWPQDELFKVPESVKALCAERVERKQGAYREWCDRYEAFKGTEAGKSFELQQQRSIPTSLRAKLLGGISHHDPSATRALSGKAIQIIAAELPGFIGGAADLETSTKTLIDDAAEVQKKAFGGRNIRFGVREHAMGAIVNGLAYAQCWQPFSATFLVFSDYMRPPIRLAALSHLQSLFIFTHDSFWVGEDGPTHQPVEQTASLRLIPNLDVYRPADGLEVAVCYLSALERKEGPSTFVFTRQNLPPLERGEGFEAEQILRGGYVLAEYGEPQVCLVATGSEASLAQQAARKLESKGVGVRVVSLPCVEVFDRQESSYRESVIPSQLKKVAIEAGVTDGWHRLVGDDGLIIGLDRFGTSAPGKEVAEEFGFTPDAMCERIFKWLAE